MGTILDQIIEQKKIEVNYLKASDQIIAGTERQTNSLIQKLMRTDEIAIIAEFKRSSPSKGVINNGIDPEVQAKNYEEYGASAISVLTDQTFFKGSFADLQAVRKAVNLPILCKDFIIDPIQINLAASSGADLILLIAAALDENKLQNLYQYASSLGLEVLVEVHNDKELEKAFTTGAKLIGVNNRDLKTFQVSLEVTERLAASVKKSGAYLISESGVHGKKDVERVRNAGANGILVGESLMESTNVKQSFLDFRLPLAGATR